MFLRREKTARADLLDPPVLVTGIGLPTRGTPELECKKPATVLLSLDQAFKLAAMMVAVTNTVLVVLGYMRYVGLLQQFGISRTEVSFTLSDLLSFGYIGFLNMTLSGQLAVAATTSTIAISVSALLLKTLEGLHSLLQMFLSWVMSVVLFFVVTGPCWFAYNPAKQSALALAASEMKVDPDKLQALTTKQEVWTENGFLAGAIVLAMPEVTYLLKDEVLYKIRASDGKVLRKTHLKAQMKETPPGA